jgi:hypothetical protein
VSSLCVQTSSSWRVVVRFGELRMISKQAFSSRWFISHEQICSASASQGGVQPVPIEAPAAMIARLAISSKRRNADLFRELDVGTAIVGATVAGDLTGFETERIDRNIGKLKAPNALGSGWTRTRSAGDFGAVSPWPARHAGAAHGQRARIAVHARGPDGWVRRPATSGDDEKP